MPVISKYIPTRAARLVEIRTWHAQKGAQHQNTFGRDAHGMPIRFFVTAGTIADCTQACALIDGVSAEYLLADRGYDSRRVIEKALRAGTNVVIPPRKNRKEQRDYDRYGSPSITLPPACTGAMLGLSTAGIQAAKRRDNHDRRTPARKKGIVLHGPEL